MTSAESNSNAQRLEPPEIRLRRLLFRCWHRGTQEGDLILGRFAEVALPGFDSVQLDRFEALLDCSDTDLVDWVSGVSAPPLQHDHDVLKLLRNFRIGPNPSLRRSSC